MKKELLKVYHKKKQLLLLSLLLLVIGAVVVPLSVYKFEKDFIYEKVDSFLKSAAFNIELILGESFFDEAVQEGALSGIENMQNVMKLSKYNDNLGTAYIYTLFIQKTADGNKVYFTSSSATKEEIKDKKETRFFDEYTEATPALRNIFTTNKILYEESTDRWGTFRSVLIPRKTDKGVPYVLGADIRIDTINTQLYKIVEKILYIESFVLVLLFLLMYLYYRFIQTERKGIAVVEERLNDEIKQKTSSLKELTKTLEKRVAKEIEKNRDKEKQLLVQARFAQMGEMISMIAHQWRQPLNAISATAIAGQMKVEMGVLNKDALIKNYKDIGSYVQHLSKTIDDFRNFFKPNKKRECVTFSELFNSVLELTQKNLTNKNIKIMVEIEDDKKFSLPVNEMRQVLLNLIKNAEDVLVEKEVKNPYIKIVAKGEKLCICDNGGGVTQEIQTKIFEPYFSTKEEKNGTGLGLYMSKIIVEDHCKGKLEVYNSTEGACFCIIFCQNLEC